MQVSYNGLWKLLIDKKIKKSQLKELAGIGPNTVVKLNKDELVSMTVLIKLCCALNCNIGDIVEVVREN